MLHSLVDSAGEFDYKCQLHFSYLEATGKRPLKTPYKDCSNH